MRPAAQLSRSSNRELKIFLAPSANYINTAPKAGQRKKETGSGREKEREREKVNKREKEEQGQCIQMSA